MVVLGANVVAVAASGQLTTSNTLTPEQLVQQVLLGGGVTVSNVTFNGLPGTTINEQIGSFDGSNSNIGLANGLMLATGDLTSGPGPNNSDFYSSGGGNFGASDADLELLVGGLLTHDKAVLEFDFVPTGDSLSFSFVFASDEYDEYVCGTVTDVFGFFVSGPGLNGPYSNNAVNIALIPNTNVPISINTVNLGVPGSTTGGDSTQCYNLDPNWSSNSVYYVQNPAGSPTVGYDGFTVVLTASVIVQCGQQYHIKLALADVGDTAFDSGVFLEGGSFTSPNAIDLEVVTASADGTLTEGCTDANFTITRPGSDSDIDVTVVVGGTATNGTDYTSIPTVITIPDGQNSVTFPIEAFEDNLAEGQEEIVLTATFINACGDTSTSSATVPIVEYVPMILSTSNLLLECEEDSVLVTAAVSGGFGDLSPVWEDGVSGLVNWVPGLEDGEYTITVTDECNKTVASTVVVESGCDIVIPNVFSPNNDGENDKFIIEGILGTSNTVTIFNRWGQKVYEASNYRNQWDADGVSDGTYYYEVTVEGAEKPFTGHLTILNNKR